MILHKQFTKTVRRSAICAFIAAAFMCNTVLADNSKPKNNREAPLALGVEYKAIIGFDHYKKEDTAIRADQVLMSGAVRLTDTTRLRVGVGIQKAEVEYSNPDIDHSGIGVKLSAKGDPVPYFLLRPEFRVFENGVNALEHYTELEGSLVAKARMERALVNFNDLEADLTDVVNSYIRTAHYRTFTYTTGFKYHHHITPEFLRMVPVLSILAGHLESNGEDIVISPYAAYVRLFVDLRVRYTQNGQDTIGSMKLPDTDPDRSVKKGTFKWDKDGGYFALSIDFPIFHGAFLRATGAYLPVNKSDIYQVSGVLVVVPDL